MIIHTNCRNFLGDVPCQPHKQFGVHCKDCKYLDPVKEQILIIKLGAIGDVIRTTPLLHRLKTIYPKAMIHWLTHTPEIIPVIVDRVYRFQTSDIEILKSTRFDYLFNLDKDREACALTNTLNAENKRGFYLDNVHCHPIDNSAKRKWITGLFDDENKKNKKNYLEETFEICGFEYNGEEYILEVHEQKNWNLPTQKIIIGLNTGCGIRWKSRLWPESHWIRLAKILKKQGYEVLFLGGRQEHNKNKSLAKQTKALYFGHFELPVFIDLVNQCDLVVTAVTMALHITLGLKKKVVLFNNIFNSNEFELFGRGNIIEPPKECKGCFMNECDQSCMEFIQPEEVLMNIKKLLD